MLKYKTRGMSNPQGKPRVYFCCHEEDFVRYFEPVSDEILKKQNCAIWYYDDFQSEADEQFYEDLKQMQLFVMPVTWKLLYQENRAIDIEFKFAVENHIPVLPLMQESGLEKRFNERCGEIQFLDKNERDLTAISYEDKLEKYLSMVLVGDELAAKIRAAFDAYVFLSYRKKDRKYAQELMRLIHKNEFCRNIAIWYDEFLTPGENFNESIKEALLKSGLFVLAVTPNVVNEINYIMTIEYPMAKEVGKPIVPAELVPTDKEALAEKYEGIPACTDAHDEELLSEALLEAVKKIAIRENDHSPEHNFFIGLAYLDGVDVEIDHERALKLIISSAEAGLMEAIDQLITMYNSGKGVNRDYEKTIKWREKKIELCRDRFQQCPGETNGHELIWAMTDCADAYREEGKAAAAKEKYQTAEQICEEFDVSSVSMLQNLLTICNRLGRLFWSERRGKEAKAYCEKALRAYELLSGEEHSIKMRQSLAIIYNNLGNIYLDESENKKAKECYGRVLEISKKIVEETGDVRVRRNLSVSYEKMGDIFRREGNYAAAEENYKESLMICKKLTEEVQDTGAYRDLSVSYNKLADIYRMSGKTEQAIESCQKAMGITLKLAEETETMEAYRDLSVTYKIMAAILKSEDKLEQAGEYYEKALEIILKLTARTETLEIRWDLASIYYMLGNLYKQRENAVKAREYYLKNHEIARQLAEETGSDKLWYDLVTAYCGSAAVFGGEERQELLQSALKIMERLCADYPENSLFSTRRENIKKMLTF